jgi:hypothetical protein
LRFEKSEARIAKQISAVDSKGEDLIRRSKRARVEWLIKGPHLGSQDQWPRSIAGLESVHILKFQGQAAIRTMVFRKGRVAVHGELWGQKKFAFKPPLVAPTIVQLHRVMALGHIEEGARGKEASP